MDLSRINNTLQTGEGVRIEFKEAQSRVPNDLYDTIASFSNTDGGTIILGVTDSGKVSGIDKSKISQYITDIVTACNTADCIRPSLFLSPTEIIHPDGPIIVLEIPVHSQIVKHGGRIFWRDGDADLDITDNHGKVSELYFRNRTQFSETTIYPGLTMADLDSNLFDEARTIIRGFRPGHPWLSIDNDRLLSEASLYRKDYNTSEEGLTMAAALIFGQDSTIQSLLPAYKVEAMVRRDNTDRWDDRITMRTNLIQTYRSLMDFIRKHLPEKFFMENDQRKDLRDLIFHEIIGNLIVHREYTSAQSSDLIIYRNSVIVTNPNTPQFHGPLDLNKFSPYPKNPNIRRFFAAFGWTEEIGSGIRNTTKYLPHYIPNARPLFIENDIFRTEIPLVYSSLSNYNEEITSWLDLSGSGFEHIQSGLSGIILDPGSGTGTWPDIILQLVPGWHEKGIRLPELDWPQKQVLIAEDIKKVPGWHEKGTKLFHKKIRYLISILVLTSSPISLDQMMEWIGYSNRKTFRNNYLQPLQQVEFLQMTNPDNPSDPDQKYVITEKGKLFLGGRDF